MCAATCSVILLVGTIPPKYAYIRMYLDTKDHNKDKNLAVHSNETYNAHFLDTLHPFPM